jgi:hypothetical protein
LLYLALRSLNDFFSVHYLHIISRSILISFDSASELLHLQKWNNKDRATVDGRRCNAGNAALAGTGATGETVRLLPTATGGMGQVELPELGIQAGGDRKEAFNHVGGRRTGARTRKWFPATVGLHVPTEDQLDQLAQLDQLDRLDNQLVCKLP